MAPEGAGSRTLARSGGHSASPRAGRHLGRPLQGSQVKARCGGWAGRWRAELRLPGGRCRGPSCREGDTDPGSPPTPVGPSTALGTPPDPRNRYFNELPGGFNKQRSLSAMKTGLCGLLLQRFHDTQKARPCLLVGLLGFQWLKLLSPGPPQGRPLASPLHFTWLRPRQHLALESQRPRCEGGRQGPRSLLGRQSHPDTCPPHSAGNFQNPDSTRPRPPPHQAPAGQSREQKATSTPPPSAGVTKQRLKAKNQTDSEAAR